MSELEYVPNLAARALRNGRTGVIALALPDMGTPYSASITSAFVEAASKRHLCVQVEESAGSAEREPQLLTRARAQLVDGLILNPVSSETSAVQPGVSLPPVVMIGEVDSPAVDRVRVNNVAAVWEMTEMLVKDGHRSIVLLGAIDSASYQVRRRGFRGALVSAGLPVSRETALDRPPVSVTVPWSLLTRENTATAPATSDRSGDRHRLPDDQPTARNRGDDATILSQEAYSC